MIVRVDMSTGPGHVDLVEPDTLDQFHVEACRPSGGAHVVDDGGAERALDIALRATGAGWMSDAGDAMIHVEWISANVHSSPRWQEQFSAMLRYAASKGWTDEGMTAIQGHVQWQ